MTGRGGGRRGPALATSWPVTTTMVAPMRVMPANELQQATTRLIEA
jgi:hypothetical protein